MIENIKAHGHTMNEYEAEERIATLENNIRIMGESDGRVTELNSIREALEAARAGSNENRSAYRAMGLKNAAYWGRKTGVDVTWLEAELAANREAAFIASIPVRLAELENLLEEALTRRNMDGSREVELHCWNNRGMCTLKYKNAETARAAMVRTSKNRNLRNFRSYGGYLLVK